MDGAAYTLTEIFRVTKSLFRQRVHILSVKVVPSISVLIFLIFGRQVLRVLLLAWLTLFPVTVCFPQISQVRDMITSLKINIRAHFKRFYQRTPFSSRCQASAPPIRQISTAHSSFRRLADMGKTG
jgi:hypothetical protein